MKKIIIFIILGSCILNCKRTSKTIAKNTKTEFNQKLADELRQMAVLDQEAANVQHGEYLKWSQERWDNFTDSVFTSHGERLKEDI